MVSADVGGTSFDTCLIINGRPQIHFEGKIVGLPVQSPWVDVRSIGAGGGSIAYVDDGGLIRSGPKVQEPFLVQHVTEEMENTQLQLMQHFF